MNFLQLHLTPSISEEHQCAPKNGQISKDKQNQDSPAFAALSSSFPIFFLDLVESDTLLTYWSSLRVELPVAVDLHDDSDDHDDFFVLEMTVEDKAKEFSNVPTPLELAAMKIL